MKTFKK